ncbi:alpha/beta hydrolase [Pigmentiphaga aceris]|nr:alpha/beta hydrolase-fold protein [Pigmentiphaga aceris]
MHPILPASSASISPLFAPRRMRIAAMLLLSACALPAFAQTTPLPAAIPPLSSPVVIADDIPVGVPAAVAREHRLVSKDGKRRYEIKIAAPSGMAPDKGFPVLFILDGRTALGALNGAYLEGAPPAKIATVFIDYEADQPNSGGFRAWDYLPGPRPGNAPQPGEEQGGGADDFLVFLDNEVIPLVKREIPVDTSRLGLYGHSYSGLFVLHALFTRSDMFQTYIATSPSLWWQNRAVSEEAKEYFQRQAVPGGRKLFVLVGGKERRQPRPGTPQPLSPDMPDAQFFSEQLMRQSSFSTRFRLIPDKNHSEMLPASIGPAIHFMN